MPSLREVRQLIEDRDVRRIDLKVSDLLGRWHHITIPPESLTETLLREGQGFDARRLPGPHIGNEADQLLLPDLSTAVIDPVPNTVSLSLICDMVDPITREAPSHDPRAIAIRAETYLQEAGVAAAARFAPELEFFIFDDARFQQDQHSAFYYVDSGEGHWNTGVQRSYPSMPIGARDGYGVVPPADQTADIRAEIVVQLRSVGVNTGADYHRAASAGQAMIGLDHAPLREMADHVQWYRYLARNVASSSGRFATFMPQPLQADHGSGMHTHQSLWDDGATLFHDSNGYAGLSQLARHYMGGLLHHAPAIMALTCPTTNSYRRLIGDLEAPTYVSYGMRNRSSAIRIPTSSMSPGSKRLEFRPPDGTANPYLAFSAMLMAGLDGIERQLDPGDPLDRDPLDLDVPTRGLLRTLPRTLDEALDALESDHAFLQSGEVFSPNLIRWWISAKRAEAADVAIRPTPYEFVKYFGG